jgi:hypothetical protein
MTELPPVGGTGLSPARRETLTALLARVHPLHPWLTRL